MFANEIKNKKLNLEIKYFKKYEISSPFLQMIIDKKFVIVLEMSLTILASNK